MLILFETSIFVRISIRLNVLVHTKAFNQVYLGHLGRLPHSEVAIDLSWPFQMAMPRGRSSTIIPYPCNKELAPSRGSFW